MVLLDMKIYNNKISTNVFLNCMITYIVVFTHFLRDIKIIKTKKKNHLKYFRTCQLVCKIIPHTVYSCTLQSYENTKVRSPPKSFLNYLKRTGNLNYMRILKFHAWVSIGVFLL